jgi:hypothetical protein
MKRRFVKNFHQGALNIVSSFEEGVKKAELPLHVFMSVKLRRGMVDRGLMNEGGKISPVSFALSAPPLVNRVACLDFNMKDSVIRTRKSRVNKPGGDVTV